MKSEKEVAQMFDVTTFEKEVKLKDLLWSMRMDVWFKAGFFFSMLAFFAVVFVENKISTRSIEKSEIIKAGLGEYKANRLTGETEFHLFKVVNGVVNGQLVKE